MYAYPACNICQKIKILCQVRNKNWISKNINFTLIFKLSGCSMFEIS